jgi:hypothetical protein
MKNPRGQIFAILNHASVNRTERLAVYAYIIRHDVTSTNDLTPAELAEVAGVLFSWSAAGWLEPKLTEILRSAA